VIRRIRKAGWKGKIVIGGYQVTSTPDALTDSFYADADILIKGQAELALMNLLADRISPNQRILSAQPNHKSLPSPYLNGVINLPREVYMLRWETKRGCPYRCDFCEYSRIGDHKVHDLAIERLEAELDLFGTKNIRKINVIDAVFNVKNNYLRLLERMSSLPIQFSLQTHFDAIKGETGDEFLKLCARRGNIHLEFGVQTLILAEMDVLQRKASIEHIREVMEKLRRLRISFETNLIYGIPGQTVQSFRESVRFLRKNGCPATDIKCFPLRIPRGSELERREIEFNIAEQQDPITGIPLVASSYSFTPEERHHTAVRARWLDWQAHLAETTFGKAVAIGSIRMFGLFRKQPHGMYELVCFVRWLRICFVDVASDIMDQSRHGNADWYGPEDLFGLQELIGSEEQRRLPVVLIGGPSPTAYSCREIHYDVHRQICGLYLERLGKMRRRSLWALLASIVHRFREHREFISRKRSLHCDHLQMKGPRAK
jgi:hypothetical protein